VIPAAQFLAARKKEILFLWKSMASAAHGSVHKHKILAQTSFCRPAIEKICLPAVEKILQSTQKIFPRVA
jgi:hypothetical protein